MYISARIVETQYYENTQIASRYIAVHVPHDRVSFVVDWHTFLHYIMANYNTLLRDPKWQRRRLEVLQRDNFTCQHCKDTTTELHVHHEAYKGKPWEIEIDKLVTLCKHCHYSLEKFPVEYIGICKIKSSFGFTVIRITVEGNFLLVFFDDQGDYSGNELFSNELVRGIVEFHHNQLSNG